MLTSLPALKFCIQGNIFIDTRFPAPNFLMLDFEQVNQPSYVILFLNIILYLKYPVLK